MRYNLLSSIAATVLVAGLAIPSFAGTIGTGAFSLWTTCGGVNPYIGSGGVIVPVGSSGCSVSVQAGQQNGGQSAGGYQFTGCFKGGSSAPNGSNEEAVFLTDDVSSWSGHEFGFVKTLNDNSLKAYLQGGGHYIWRVISTGDNGYHTFKCQCQSGNHSAVDFYVDGSYKFTLTNSGSNYWYNWDYFVSTTHRESSGWGSSGEQIETYSMSTW